MFMTENEIKEFDEYGCIARSLMFMAEAEGNPISMEEFCKRCRPVLSACDPFGCLSNDQIGEVADKLGVGGIPVRFTDYDSVKGYFDRGLRRILAFSEVDLSPGAIGRVKHCSLLTGICGNNFTIRTPLSGGGEFFLTFDRAQWAAKSFTGMIIQP